MMRRSSLLLAVLALAVMALPVQTSTAAIYTAPHYYAPRVQQTNYGAYGAYGNCSPYGGCGPCSESPCAKLSRGVNNALTGWLEVPKQVVTGVFNCNVTPLDGMAVGLGRGVARGLERTGVGIYEAVTFFMPGCGPLLCPEYISLEPGCMNWRYGSYRSPFCAPCPPPCGPAQCAPFAPCAPRAAGPPPGAQGFNALRNGTPQANPGVSQPALVPRNPGPAAQSGVSYPDDYLK
jgi:putative exosortase-associated protein (TIGR04073 family)